MTEEQKAEEWADKNISLGAAMYNPGMERKCKQAFIDGYHECQKEHEWHYVKDGDLPEDHKCVLLSNIYGHTETGYYNNGEWFGRNVVFDDVFAWQELPRPSKEMVQAWEEHKPPKEIE